MPYAKKSRWVLDLCERKPCPKVPQRRSKHRRPPKVCISLSRQGRRSHVHRRIYENKLTKTRLSYKGKGVTAHGVFGKVYLGHLPTKAHSSQRVQPSPKLGGRYPKVYKVTVDQLPDELPQYPYNLKHLEMSQRAVLFHVGREGGQNWRCTPCMLGQKGNGSGVHHTIGYTQYPGRTINQPYCWPSYHSLCTLRLQWVVRVVGQQGGSRAHTWRTPPAADSTRWTAGGGGPAHTWRGLPAAALLNLVGGTNAVNFQSSASTIEVNFFLNGPLRAGTRASTRTPV